jgi:hypothetical protein
MPSLTFLILIAVIGALALIPTRRLFTSGWSGGTLAAYFATIFAMGVLIALTRGRVGFLLPILVLAYIAPFVTARDGIRRVRDRMGGGGLKNVTPPEKYVRSQPRDPGADPSGRE